MKLAWDGGLQTLESLGATIVPVSLPHTRHALPAYYVLALAEAASNLARYDGMEYGLRHEDVAATRQLGFGQEVRRRLMLGYHVLTQSAYEDYYVKAQRIRRLIVEDFDRVFKRVRHTHQSLQGQVDALVVPTALGKAPLLSECNEDDWVNDVMTVPASLAGLPAISLPCGGGLGLQVLTQFGDEQMLFHVSKLLERE
jgi:aspartyl-tRNA(Asn)/glutamyl-tRNA(Gln) amidotransferase subunit A